MRLLRQLIKTLLLVPTLQDIKEHFTLTNSLKPICIRLYSFDLFHSRAQTAGSVR